MAITDKRFNLSINGSNNGFQYGAQYVSGTDNTLYKFSYKNGWDGTEWTPIQFESTNPVEFNKDNSNEYSVAKDFNNYLEVQKSTLKLYFPRWSVESFGWNNHLYVLTASTFVNGLECILCRCIIDRNDAIAAEEEFVLSNERFYDCITLEIPDAYKICYDSSNDMKSFRNSFQWNNTTPSDLNDEGAMIYVELTPVNYSDGLWIPSEIYSTGSNSVHLDPLGTNNLRYEISINPSDNTIKGSIHYNSEYDNLIDYIEDTYPGYSPANTLYKFFITNKDGIYVELEDDEINSGEVSAEESTSLSSSASWNDFVEGLLAYSVVYIQDENGLTLLQLDSNEIPITTNNFSILLGENQIDNTNISDMPTYNIVNRIENNIVNINRPDDYSAHIVTPVFIRTQQTSNISVHPKVIEYIAIPLDAYKSSVKTFILKLEEARFTEHSRTAAGIVFRVVGSMLTQDAIETTYYILNENNEYVTSGNCKYII